MRIEKINILLLVSLIVLILAVLFPLLLLETLQETSIEIESLNKILKKEIENLSFGKIVYNPPKEMTEFVGEIIEARISHNVNKELTKGLEGRGIPLEESIKVSTIMTARLSGDTFNILYLSDKEQIVPPEEYTAEWEWEVIPQKAGYRKLYLSVSVVLDMPEFGEKKISLPVMKKKIHVKVNPDKTRETNLGDTIIVICAIIGGIGTLFGIYINSLVSSYNSNSFNCLQES